MTADYEWAPLRVDEAAALFSTLGTRWWIAGGCAVDVYLGQRTREHADIDLAVLRGGQAHLRALLPEWDVQVAHGGQLSPWDGAPLVTPRHQFWVRRRAARQWAFEILLEDHADGEWRYRKDARITLPIDRFGRTTPDGVPHVAPEVTLLYKAGFPEIERNLADFEALLPRLDFDARAWLASALDLTMPGHAWPARLRV